MNDYTTRSTKSMKAVAADFVMGECCEPDCKMSLILEKNDLAHGRKVRCTACLMKSKLRT